MTWQGDPRTSSGEWRRKRARILRRDRHRCYVCGGEADEVDHVLAKANGGSDHDANLAAICRRCHLRKSSQEGNQARWNRAPRRRPPEQHPGMA